MLIFNYLKKKKSPGKRVTDVWIWGERVIKKKSAVEDKKVSDKPEDKLEETDKSLIFIRN